MNWHSILAMSFALTSTLPFAHDAQAQSQRMVACAHLTSGKITIRPRCTRFERPMSTSDLQLVGPQGTIGPEGPRGAQGPQGERGAAGPTGPIGPQGQTGPQGTVGNQGPIGAQGLPGAQGVAGPQGPVGLRGADGVRGESAFESIPSGRTVYGVVGADFNATSTDGLWGTAVSLPAPAPIAFGNEHTVINNNTVVDNDCQGATCLVDEELNHSNMCTGSAANPTAPQGWICVYPQSVQNIAARTLRATALPAGSSRYGFFVRWRSLASGVTGVRMVWAYTAP